MCVQSVVELIRSEVHQALSTQDKHRVMATLVHVRNRNGLTGHLNGDERAVLEAEQKLWVKTLQRAYMRLM